MNIALSGLDTIVADSIPTADEAMCMQRGFAFLGLISRRTQSAAERPFQPKKPSLGLWRGESGLPVVG